MTSTGVSLLPLSNTLSCDRLLSSSSIEMSGELGRPNGLDKHTIEIT
jgi:hypothetical protein